MTDAQNMAYEAAKIARRRWRGQMKARAEAPGTFEARGYHGGVCALDKLATEVLLLAFTVGELHQLLAQIDAELARGN